MNRSKKEKQTNGNDSILFEDLVRLIYDMLKNVGQEDYSMSYIEGKPKLHNERRLSVKQMYSIFLTVSEEEEMPSSQFMSEMLSAANKKGFRDDAFYNILRGRSIRTNYLQKVKNEMAELSADYNKSLPEYGSEMNELYEKMILLYNDSNVSDVFSLIESPDRDGTISCICEMLFNALTFNLMGNISKAIYRKAYLKERFFVGREKELNEIKNRLENHEIAVISGEPGIGKSELAFRYAFLNRDHYSMIKFVSYSDSIKETLCKIQRTPSFDKFQFSAYDIVRVLSAYSDSALLIIEDADEKALTPEVISWLNKADFDIIITSRYRYDDAIDLKRMEENEILAIMCNQASNEQKKIEFSNTQNFIEIMNHSGGNTVLSVLFASALNVSTHKVDAILKNDPSVLYNSEVMFAENNSEQQNKKTIKTVYQHFSSLFDNYLSDEAVHTLYFFTLLNFFEPPISLMKKLCPSCTDNMIEYLQRYHILEVGCIAEELYCRFNTIAFQVFQNRAFQAQEDYSDEISAIYSLLTNYNRDIDFIPPAVLLNLALVIKSDSEEWVTCKKMIFGFLQAYYPYSKECEELQKHLCPMNNKDLLHSAQYYPDYVNHYYSLFSQKNKAEEYRQYVRDHFIQKMNADAILIKQWLKNAENCVLSGTFCDYKNICDQMIGIIKGYLFPEMLDLSLPEQFCIDNALMIKSLSKELRVSTLEDTILRNSITSRISIDDMAGVPDIFSELERYKIIVFNILNFYLIGLFYLDTSDDNELKRDITNLYNNHIHDHLLLSDDNRIVLLSQLAKMKATLGRYEEAEETINEAEEFSKTISIPNYIFKYCLDKLDVLTRLYIHKKVDNLKSEKEHPSLDDLDGLIYDCSSYYNHLLKEIHQDYSYLKLDIKEIRDYSFVIFQRNFKEIIDNAKYSLGLIKAEELSFVLSPGKGKPTQIDSQMLTKAFKTIDEVAATLLKKINECERRGEGVLQGGEG